MGDSARPAGGEEGGGGGMLSDEGQSQSVTSRAGHLRYFLIFSIVKNDFLHFLSS